MHYHSLLAISIVFLTTLVPWPAYAHDCGRALPFEETSIEADEIFLGRLVRAKEIKEENVLFDNNWAYYKLEFNVIKKWKGNHLKHVTIYLDHFC